MAVNVYNGWAYVNLTNNTYTVYDADLKTYMGVIYPNECFGKINMIIETSADEIIFRKGNGSLEYGFIPFASKVPNAFWTPFAGYKSNGKTLEKLESERKGYRHKVNRGPLRYYVGAKQAGTLPVGTEIIITNTCGAEHPYRIELLEYKNSSGIWIKANSSDTSQTAWIDYLTLGSYPDDRSIY